MVDVVCVEQPQASWEERSMKHYAGLDVSVKETSICIVDEAGRICREMKVVSHPEDLLAVLCDLAWRPPRGIGNVATRTPPQARSRRKRLKSRSAGSVNGFSEILGSSTPSYASLRHWAGPSANLVIMTLYLPMALPGAGATRRPTDVGM